MSTFRLLMTKKINASLVLQAGLKGIEILEKEFISIIPVTNENLNKKISRLISADHTVAFTSKNAVSAIEWNNELPNANWKIFCIEGATKNALKKYFTEKSIKGTAKSALLLAEVIAEKSEEKKIIFFCGSKRMEDLPGLLLSKGIDVEEVIVYKTELVPQKIIDDFEGVAFFSPSAAESFFSVNTLKKNVVCLSVGKTTSEAIKKYTDNEVVTAEKSSEESILELAIKHSKY